MTLEEFRKEYKYGIIVNYDKNKVYRASTNKVEQIADGVNYPYIQRYQKGENPRTTLFIIINNTFKKIERINKFDENSNYKVLDTLYNVSPLLYEDPIFNEEGSKPIIINEDLLKIEE